MKIKEYISKLKKISACDEALQDVLIYETSQELWEKCERGDWMLWLVFRTQNIPENEIALRKITGTKVKCARLVQHLMKDKRSLNALDVAERFSIGQATRKELDAAAYAAYAAYDAAYAYDAADAAYDAAAAHAAADAAYDAAYDAAAAAYDAYDTAAAHAAAKTKILKQCADIVRADYPNIDELFEKGGE